MSEEKRGGPYTKPEQGKRRKRVYEMYFEKGRSAVSIARELGVNRNTVNEDIKILTNQIGDELCQESVRDFLIRHVERIDLQRERLMMQLENAEGNERIRIEKMLLDIEMKIISQTELLLVQECVKIL
jgi:transposase-like protein